ncbi:major facilitator transporter [Cohnella kolymensis]|uniref:Major facilitator transporter n=1 Tax=Cohnella kolymensis TaxID=1590652 RepID=A0ABR5A1C8_9BACL|nr:MFS transporter [Cohnella kolymensis]KIL34360.1 major facilitator transporter [Cohnella kolymensis]
MSKATLLREPAQRRLLFSAGLSWLFDAMEVGMVAFVIAAVAADWNLGPQQVGLISAINSLGMAAGAAFAGAFADKYGRRSVLIWTLLIFCAASGLSALATSFFVLCLLRFVAGFGLGGELPVASTLVSESVPVKDRGRAVVLLESFWAGGWIVSAVIAYFVIPEYGWRMALVIGALPALYALYLRRAIQESPRYRTSAAKLSFRQRLAAVWSTNFRKSTITLWVLWFTVVFSYYGMFLWLPSVIMIYKDFDLVKSFQYVLIMSIAQLPGYFTAAYLVEKFGRKFVLVTYLLLTAASAIWFGNADTSGMLIAAGCCLSFFNLGAWGAMYAYSPELYPTSVRSTGVGLAASVGRIGGVIGPYLVGILVAQDTPMTTIFTIFFVTIIIGAITVLFFGKETKGIDPDSVDIRLNL